MQNIDIALQAAVAAGKKILEIYSNPASDFSIESKSDKSPLTIADKAAHLIITQQLKKTSLPVLSEEGREIPYKERKNWNSFWMVDPLDGTKEFIKKNGEFTVNIALIENNKPVAGIIYVPVTNVLYMGIKDKGAFMLSEPKSDIDIEAVTGKGSRLPRCKRYDIFKVVGSRSHMSEETEIYIKTLRKKHQSIKIVSKGSSLKICMVAEGKADEYPRFGPTMEWDTAAGHAIANAAGKKLWLTDFSGELEYNKENLMNPWFIVR